MTPSKIGKAKKSSFILIPGAYPGVGFGSLGRPGSLKGHQKRRERKGKERKKEEKRVKERGKKERKR